MEYDHFFESNSIVYVTWKHWHNMYSFDFNLINNFYCLFLSIRRVSDREEKGSPTTQKYRSLLPRWRTLYWWKAGMSSIPFRIQRYSWIVATSSKSHLQERKHISSNDSMCIYWTFVFSHNFWWKLQVPCKGISPMPTAIDSDLNRAKSQRMWIQPKYSITLSLNLRKGDKYT